MFVCCCFRGTLQPCSTGSIVVPTMCLQRCTLQHACLCIQLPSVGEVATMSEWKLFASQALCLSLRPLLITVCSTGASHVQGRPLKLHSASPPRVSAVEDSPKLLAPLGLLAILAQAEHMGCERLTHRCRSDFTNVMKVACTLKGVDLAIVANTPWASRSSLCCTVAVLPKRNTQPSCN
jgi:hypothetical protein